MELDKLPIVNASDELTLIRKIIMAYINTTLSNEEKKVFSEMLKAELNSPKADIS